MTQDHQTELDFDGLNNLIEGTCHSDALHLMMYATDASVYRNLPKGVVCPKTKQDVVTTLKWCSRRGVSVTPRAAGTSLAGQCVGDGMILDMSRYFDQIIDFDANQKTVTLQPGVVRDDLNRYLKPHGLFFGPNTSTSSRCTIGGMVGNNSSGTTSIKYGVTRDKILAVSGYLSDGRPVTFQSKGYSGASALKTANRLDADLEITTAHGLKSSVFELLETAEARKQILDNYPKPSIHRRNTGYALDLLASQWNDSRVSVDELDLLPLICGSEGTLMVTTSITIQLDELPPKHNALVVLQYRDLEHCMLDVVSAMKHDLYTCELIDDVVLDCTAQNTMYNGYRFFVKGTPKAVLFCELRDVTQEGLAVQIDEFYADLQGQKRAYDIQVLRGEEIDKAIKLRIAGLGLLGAMVGDKKAVACIEDTAVSLEDLPEFIRAFTDIMNVHNQKAVYYAHAGAGELHLRPILDLKQDRDKRDFRKITEAVSTLVKQYRGSFSGEHGDGIVRSEFIKAQIGQENYTRLTRVKIIFDPGGLLNPGKIVNPWPMDQRLRVDATKNTPEIDTSYDFSDQQGILCLSEQCNGSGDCRNSHEYHGMLCPSYQATKNERDTTRARANVLREVLSKGQTQNERWGTKALHDAFDLCVGCKACHNECPSKVDMATVKSEVQHQRRKLGYSKKSDWFFGHNTMYYKYLFALPTVLRTLLNSRVIQKTVKTVYDIAPERSLPKFPNKSFAQRLVQSKRSFNVSRQKNQKVYLWVDEFSDYLEPEISQDAYDLLIELGYEVNCITGLNSARALLSKGYLDKAKNLIDQNLDYFESTCIDGPILGIEPSALYGIRDEYTRLASDKEKAKKLKAKAFIVEEFLANELRQGSFGVQDFTEEPLELKLHLHCHQKSLGQVIDTFELLNLPIGYRPVIIPSGCCGMAGSFGFEKEHYQTSMAMAELHLLPAARKAKTETIIVANGISCRHQIQDGTQKTALHPITVIRRALK